MKLSPLRAAKAQLRKSMAIRLDALAPEEILKQTHAVTEQVVHAPWFKNAQRISVYVNTSGEIVTDTLVRTCLRLGKELFIPQFKRKDPRMRLLRLKTEKEFENLDSTLWNIRQHHQDTEAPEYIETGPLDVILMPGVAFTTSGDRLGHGMGYYDKLLAEHAKLFGKYPLKIALALNEQIVSDVPLEETDVPVDEVLYEKSIGNELHPEKHIASEGM